MSRIKFLWLCQWLTFSRVEIQFADDSGEIREHELASILILDGFSVVLRLMANANIATCHTSSS